MFDERSDYERLVTMKPGGYEKFTNVDRKRLTKLCFKLFGKKNYSTKQLDDCVGVWRLN